MQTLEQRPFGGLMLGAAFATWWRPMAILRGPLRRKGRQLDLLALFGLVVLAVLMWSMYLLEEGRYNAWLFRIKPANAADVEKLMDAAAYAKSIG